jgi:phosphoribosylanthranilate isomerase
MTLIKICGLTSVEDAVEVACMDVQIIGLVFAHGRRQVSLEVAKEISAAVKSTEHPPAIAGVFVNENPRVVNETVRQCKLDIVQLSGDESAGYCCQISAPVIKVIHIRADARSRDIIEGVRKVPHTGQPAIYLLDSKEDGKYGGTGFGFNRDIAKEISDALPVIIAGGLDPRNVAGLIEHARPVGVDVSSGVETSGRKDITKIRAFIKAVRSADGSAAAGSNNLLNKYILKGELNVT